MSEENKLNFEQQPQSVSSFFSEDAPESDSTEPQPAEQDTPAAIRGVCKSCLNTGFVHGIVNGVLGALYTTGGFNSEGKEKKKLLICDHGKSYGY